jgi:hypothetical protein
MNKAENGKFQKQDGHQEGGCGKAGIRGGAFYVAGKILKPLYQETERAAFAGAIVNPVSNDIAF